MRHHQNLLHLEQNFVSKFWRQIFTFVLSEKSSCRSHQRVPMDIPQYLSAPGPVGSHILQRTMAPREFTEDAFWISMNHG